MKHLFLEKAWNQLAGFMTNPAENSAAALDTINNIKDTVDKSTQALHALMIAATRQQISFAGEY